MEVWQTFQETPVITVLYVDDEEALLDIVKIYLECTGNFTDCGFRKRRVGSAENGTVRCSSPRLSDARYGRDRILKSPQG